LILKNLAIALVCLAITGCASEQPKKKANPIVLPKYNVNPAPVYSPESQAAGEQGKVMLNLFINAQGFVQKAELKASSGYSRLDQSAVNAVKNWRFIPAKRGGQAIDSWIVVPILFSLKDIDPPTKTKPKK